MCLNNRTQIQLTDNSDSGKLCGAAAVSPTPLMTASPTPYHTTPLSRFSGPDALIECILQTLVGVGGSVIGNYDGGAGPA
ncbi:hypothetical protein J6590_044479 [Homalodisca vitripennis]|nr:hypothetical protein J6590_044479 [Homalodisca vitripennis]